MSIILLILICLPLVFVVPMWLQYIVLGVPRTELALDPVHMFGIHLAFWLTLLLGLVSFVLGYAYIIRLKPGKSADEELEEEEDEEEEKEVEEDEAETLEEEQEEELDEVSEDDSEEEVEEDSAEEINEV